MPFRSDFLATLDARGFIHQCTDDRALDEVLSGGPVSAYIGFDATADSLHVGHLLQLMSLRHLQRSGHRPIVVIGGGTTQVGDPSFRDDSRPMLDAEAIAANKASLMRIFDRFLTFGDGPADAIMVDNADWLDPLRFLGFLRDVGVHFTVNRMLSFDSVKLRLDREQPLTLLEFNYMVLQAFDFLELSRREGCLLQMGGSDQWGNIVNGVELARRVDRREVFGLTTPLLATSSGAKMGKTRNGAVWLNSDRTTPYAFWQFWRDTEDADVGRFLRLFTEIPTDEIARLETLSGASLNEAKEILASAVTTLVHGEEAASRAAEDARKAFAGEAAEGLPSLALPTSEWEAGIPVWRLLAQAGLATSNAEARRLIKGGGARVNGVPVTEEGAIVGTSDLDADGRLRISAGRKRHAVATTA